MNSTTCGRAVPRRQNSAGWRDSCNPFDARTLCLSAYQGHCLSSSACRRSLGSSWIRADSLAFRCNGFSTAAWPFAVAPPALTPFPGLRDVPVLLAHACQFRQACDHADARRFLGSARRWSIRQCEYAQHSTRRPCPYRICVDSDKAAERKPDRRRPSGDDIGQRATRAAGQGPAQGAVARIQIQIADAAAADYGQVVGRRGPQPRPGFRRASTPRSGKSSLVRRSIASQRAALMLTS